MLLGLAACAVETRTPFRAARQLGGRVQVVTLEVANVLPSYPLDARVPRECRGARAGTVRKSSRHTSRRQPNA